MMRITLLIAANAALVSLTPAQRVAEEITAIKAGTVWIGNGKTLKNAVILIKDGRIEKVGQGLEIPWNAKVLDAGKRWVMPAWVNAHTSGGMDQANENIQVTPYLTVLDSVDPSQAFFEASRRYGVGTLHVVPGNACAVGGRGMVVRPAGKTPEQMALVLRAGMKMSLQPKRGSSRSRHIAEIMKAFEDAKAHRAEWERKKKEFDEDKKNGATTKKEFEDKIDKLKQPLLDLLDRKTTAYLYIPRASDVPAALELVKTYRLSAVFVLGGDCYKAIDLLTAAHRQAIPLILGETLEITDKDPVTEEEKIVCPARILYDAGIPFALTATGSGGRGSRGRGASGGTHPAMAMPWWQVATCVRHGVPERAALEAFTTIPARILGLTKRVGQISEGLDANLQVLSAAPMEPECQVENLVVDGILVYDRKRDPRVSELTGQTTTGASKEQK